MSNIRLEIEEPYNGQFVTFTAPCNCDAITDGLVINDNVYTVVDAMDNCVTTMGGAWIAGAKVSVVLDVNNRKAFIQNSACADKATIAYVDDAVADKAPAYTYGTTDMTAGTSELETGKLYFVYE